MLLGSNPMSTWTLMIDVYYQCESTTTKCAYAPIDGLGNTSLSLVEIERNVQLHYIIVRSRGNCFVDLVMIVPTGRHLAPFDNIFTISSYADHSVVSPSPSPSCCKNVVSSTLSHWF